MVCRISGKLHQSRIAKQMMHAENICEKHHHRASLEIGQGRDVEVGMVNVVVESASPEADQVRRGELTGIESRQSQRSTQCSAMPELSESS